MDEENKVQYVKCTGKCGKSLKLNTSNFYRSYSPLYKGTGFVSICKKCVQNLFESYIKSGKDSRESLIEICRLLDIPFIDEAYDTVIKKNNGTFNKKQMGNYFGQIKLKQWLKRNITTFNDSIYKPKEVDSNTSQTQDVANAKYDIDALKFKWGFGYTNDEYIAFEKKYDFLRNNYPEKTNMHIEALQTYVRYKVKAEICTAQNDVKTAKEWGAMAGKAAQDAKINPSQLSKADLTGGLNGFGELSRAVEQVKDIISILPKFKEKPQDKVDFTLWQYINYVRDLKGLPPCKYSDIYQFYELRKKEYEEHVSKEDDIFIEKEESSETDGDS